MFNDPTVTKHFSTLQPLHHLKVTTQGQVGT